MKLNRNIIIILVAALIGVIVYFMNRTKDTNADDDTTTRSAKKQHVLAPAPAPYPTPELNALYNLIFCDRTEIVESKLKKPYPYPYSVIFDAASSVEDLRKVITTPQMDTRVRTVAWNKLRERDMRNKRRMLLGVVIEIGMEKGLDVLAVYDDLAARYINQSGKVLANETTDKEAGDLVKKMLENSEVLKNEVQPYDERKDYPATGTVRLTLITTDGLCKAEGAPDAMFQGASTAPVLQTATKLVQLLTARAEAAAKAEGKAKSK